MIQRDKRPVLASRLADELSNVPKPKFPGEVYKLGFESDLVDQVRLSRLPIFDSDPNPPKDLKTLFVVTLRAEVFRHFDGKWEDEWLEWVIDL